MRVCVLATQLDGFKGGNHLPLFGALKDVDFAVITGKAKMDGSAPKNVEVISLNAPLGSYYFGRADDDFANALLKKHPPTDAFWKQFDVLHLNQTLSPKLLALKESGVPLLYAVHHPVTADKKVAVEETGFVKKILWTARYARLIRWQRELCRAAPHILTVSQTVKHRLIADYDADGGKISVVPNGVNGKEFHPSEESPVADVIAVGSFVHPRKGFPYLIEAYRALAARGYRIADVGRRSGDQANALRKMKSVTVHGPVSHEKLVELMRRSSVLLSTSLYEGFGISLIESLACGHPAFAFGAGAVPEVLKPIDPTLTVPVRDVDELVKRTSTYLELSEQERAEKGRELRMDVLKRYALGNAAELLGALYCGLSR